MLWSGEMRDKVGVRWELQAVQTGAEGGGLEDNWGRVPGEGRAAAEVLRSRFSMWVIFCLILNLSMLWWTECVTMDVLISVPG